MSPYTAPNSSIDIDKKISSAQTKSESLFKRELTWQEKVDNLLDRMNELNGLLISLHTILLNLTIEIDRDFNGFKESAIATDAIQTINTITAKLLRKVRLSDLYPGVKTTYLLIKQENNYLRELLSDRSTSIDLESDKKLAEIMERTIKAIEKNKSLRSK